jgi:hypothetical protein
VKERTFDSLIRSKLFDALPLVFDCDDDNDDDDDDDEEEEEEEEDEDVCNSFCITWISGHTSSKRKKFKTVRIDHKLPKNYNFSPRLNLSQIYKMFKAPSGRGNMRIRALENIDKPTFDFNNTQQLRIFKKGKAVVDIRTSRWFQS